MQKAVAVFGEVLAKKASAAMPALPFPFPFTYFGQTVP